MFAARLLAHRTPKSALRPQQAETDEPDLPAMQNDDSEATSEPAAVNLPPVVIPPSQLLISHRLAATFGSMEDIERFCAPGAFSILRGFGAEDHDMILKTLKIVLPDQGWQIVSPSVSDGAVSKTATERMLREANRSLDITTPVLVLQPHEISLPAYFQSPGIYQLTYAPVSPEILLSVLALLNRTPDDEQAFKAALPDSTLLARLDMAEIATALRFASGIEVAERLSALTCPATEGSPRLDVGFADSPAVDAARRLVADLKAWQRGEIGWSDCSHSLLVYGPPGTGKTWLARAMSNAAGIVCIEGSFAEWQSAGHLGDMLREMRRTFALARGAAPAILIIDEIDAAGSRNGDDKHNLNYRTQVINAFLGEMNALATVPGVIVVGACNHPDRLDPAITRAGRFDIKVEMPMPDADAILAVLRLHLGDDFPDEELELLARQAVGHSLASIDAAIRAARSEARHAGKPLDLAMLRDQLHLSSDGEDREVLWRYAVHEAGHTVVAAALRLGTIQRMSISRNGGEVASRPVIGHGVLTEIENEICHDLAGRAAEALIFGEVSAGAGGSLASDLSQATRRALMIDTNWGLGELGPIWMPAPETVLLTDEQLRNRVRSRMEAAEKRALAILTTHRANLISLAQTLLEKRSMRKEEILPWVHAVQAHVAQADEVNPADDKGHLET
jgi:MoxR-like ATPase